MAKMFFFLHFLFHFVQITVVKKYYKVFFCLFFVFLQQQQKHSDYLLVCLKALSSIIYLFLTSFSFVDANCLSVLGVSSISISINELKNTQRTLLVFAQNMTRIPVHFLN